jgi:hypothetical protein
VGSELATVIDEDEWRGRLEMREALDDIAQRYQLGKYAEEEQPRKRRTVRRRPSAKVIDMQEWLAARGRGPERRRPRTTGDS